MPYVDSSDPKRAKARRNSVHRAVPTGIVETNYVGPQDLWLHGHTRIPAIPWANPCKSGLQLSVRWFPGLSKPWGFPHVAKKGHGLCGCLERPSFIVLWVPTKHQPSSIINHGNHHVKTDMHCLQLGFNQYMGIRCYSLGIRNSPETHCQFSLHPAAGAAVRGRFVFRSVHIMIPSLHRYKINGYIYIMYVYTDMYVP